MHRPPHTQKYTHTHARTHTHTRMHTHTHTHTHRERERGGMQSPVIDGSNPDKSQDT